MCGWGVGLERKGKWTKIQNTNKTKKDKKYKILFDCSAQQCIGGDAGEEGIWGEWKHSNWNPSQTQWNTIEWNTMEHNEIQYNETQWNTMNTIRETGEMAKKWELYHLVFIQHWMITKHSMQAENSLSKFVVCSTFYLECWWGAFASNSCQIHNKLLTSDMCNTFYLELPNYHFLFVLLLSAVLNNSPSHSVLCILKNSSDFVFWWIL